MSFPIYVCLLILFFLAMYVSDKEKSVLEWIKAHWVPTLLLTLLVVAGTILPNKVKDSTPAPFIQKDETVSAYVMGFRKGKADICYMVDTVRYVDVITVSSAEWSYFFFDPYGTMRKPLPTERDGTGTDVTHVDILLCPVGDSLYLEFNGYRKVSRWMNKHLKQHFGGQQ